MKKTLLTLALTLLAVISASAQAFRKSTGPIIPAQAGAIVKAPQKAPAGTTEWGYYNGAFGNLGGLGTGQTGVTKAAIKVSGAGAFSGAKIHGVNLPIQMSENYGSVSVWIATSLTATPVVTKVLDVSSLTTGYNEVLFDAPYTIPATGVYVGYSIDVKTVATQADNYPLCVANVEPQSGTSMLYAGGWMDSSGYGTVALRLFLSDLNQRDYDATFTLSGPAATAQGGTVNMPVEITSNGTKAINDIDYKVDIDGQIQAGHATLARPIPAGLQSIGETTITFTAPQTIKVCTAKIYIEKINGQPNAAAATAYAAGFKVLSRIATRHTAVEEFTGTGCGWCPRGWVGMETLKQTRPNFVGLAFHNYNSGDPMYFQNWPHSFSEAPSCMIDRSSGEIDPYYGSGGELGIVADFDYFSSIAPDVELTATARFQGDNQKVDVSAEMEYLTNGGKYSLAYALTADSLSGTTSIWKQSNYFYSNSASEYGSPELQDFCQGGKYGQSKVFLTFNDVLIGSSYSYNKTTGACPNLATAISGTAVADTKVQGSYAVPMPTAAGLLQAIKRDKVFAVVLAIASDGTVANAVRVPVETNACDAFFTSCGSATVKAGETATLPVTIANYGKHPINNFDYLFIAGEDTITGHADLAEPIATKATGAPRTITIQMPATEEGKLYSGVITITKVNGVDNSARKQTVPATVKVIARTTARTSVIEQFVGTDCGEAPLAYAAMEAIKTAKPECVRLSVHKGVTTDPMYIANYAKIITTLPNCVIDRASGEINPYYGSNGNAMGVLADIDRCNAMPAEAGLEITKAQFDDTNKKVKIDVKADFLLTGEKYGIAYILTADSLTGTADTWKQTNAYADKMAQDVNNDANLLPYCQGGQYGQSSVMLTYNDVVIAATYNASGANSGTNITTPSKADTTITKTVTVAMPTKTTLKTAINRDNVYAVAIMTANSNGAIVNVSRVKVGKSEAELEVKGIEAKATAKPAARYNLAGQRIDAPARGMNIIRMSDGTVRKVMAR